MIITSSKSYDDLTGMLNKGKRLGIVACDSCSSSCDTGGRRKLDEITARLKEYGYDVVNTDLIPMPCNVDLKEISGFDVDEFLILACDAAVNTFQMLFPSKKIIPGLKTIGLGARDAQGNIRILKDLKK
ncbi:MAG: hypothetical protein ABID61_01185 [Candidatus Micrarchaeota archaeon]